MKQKKINSWLEELLIQQRDCFHMIQAESERFLTECDALSVSAVLDLLRSRQEWVDRIKALEARRQELIGVNTGFSNVVTDLQKAIATSAQALVAIDARILDILNTAWLEHVGQMAGVAGKRRNEGRRLNNPDEMMNRINILQE